MTNFYGRKIPRGADKEEIKKLFNCSYFFHKDKEINLRSNLLSWHALARRASGWGADPKS